MASLLVHTMCVFTIPLDSLSIRVFQSTFTLQIYTKFFALFRRFYKGFSKLQKRILCSRTKNSKPC